MLASSIVIPLISGILLLLAIANITHLTIAFAFWIVYISTIGGLLLLWNSKLLWNNQKLIQFLHQKYPELEYSLSVFFEKELNSLEKQQQSKVIQQLPAIQEIAFPISLRREVILLIFSGLLYSSSFVCQMDQTTENLFSPTENEVEFLIKDTTQQPSSYFDYKVLVYPPRYTRLKNFQWEQDKKIAEGSRLVFSNQGNIDFDLIWQNQYESNLSERQSKSFVLNQSSIFQIEYEQRDSLISLKPKILEMKRDEVPMLSTNLEENRYNINWEDLKNGFKLDLTIEDDYRIVSADIILTLSRGEGESVKFREAKGAISGISKSLKLQQKKISLQLDTFSLKPGDELYFYFSAKDNKEPKGNIGRTDVYFISIADTVESVPVAYEGFALTNEAEYFKSQRQIIIDTKKLLEEQHLISQDEFDKRSNSIGADQKLLRLRYGVFLGEEYETTGGLGEVDHSGHDHAEIEGAVDKHEGHDHDANEEQESEAMFSNPIYNETPELEAYVHAHDDSELSTFLDANVKVKLKDALTNMWEAELFLRTYKPKEALPFEYKALKLIKEVKRASRIYVERMGFEPPPIDEAKRRLTGDLEKIEAQATEDHLKEKSFEVKLSETYSKLKLANQLEDIQMAVAALDSFTDYLVSKITSEPVRYGNLLAAIKQFQTMQSKNELRTVLIIMEDMLEQGQFESVRQAKSIRTSLHDTYYDLMNE